MKNTRKTTKTISIETQDFLIESMNKNGTKYGEVKSFSIAQILLMLVMDMIEIAQCQRNYVTKKAEGIIASVITFRGLPVLILNEYEEGKFEIIDGQQRFISLLIFFSGVFSHKNIDIRETINCTALAATIKEIAKNDPLGPVNMLLTQFNSCYTSIHGKETLECALANKIKELLIKSNAQTELQTSPLTFHVNNLSEGMFVDEDALQAFEQLNDLTFANIFRYAPKVAKKILEHELKFNITKGLTDEEKTAFFTDINMGSTALTGMESIKGEMSKDDFEMVTKFAKEIGVNLPRKNRFSHEQFVLRLYAIHINATSSEQISKSDGFIKIIRELVKKPEFTENFKRFMKEFKESPDFKHICSYWITGDESNPYDSTEKTMQLNYMAFYNIYKHRNDEEGEFAGVIEDASDKALEAKYKHFVHNVPDAYIKQMTNQTGSYSTFSKCCKMMLDIISKMEEE